MEIELQNVTIGSLKRHYKVLEFFFITQFWKNRVLKEENFPN